MIYRLCNNGFEVLLIHPGGPFYKRRDEGIWSIPKGLMDADEDPLTCAIREFTEETGFIPQPPFKELGTVRYKSGKLLTAWAAEGNFNADEMKSNTFPLEWPPKSGKFIDVPEADQAAWFDAKTARIKLLPAQLPLIATLEEIIL